MIQSVKVKNLSLSKDNVRKSSREAGIEALAASIATQGLLQNLIVTPLKKAGHFTVKAGGRRLRALQSLIEQGSLPARGVLLAQPVQGGLQNPLGPAAIKNLNGREFIHRLQEIALFSHRLVQGDELTPPAALLGTAPLTAASVMPRSSPNCA